MRWFDALKTFNEGKTMWCIPRKGGPEHKEIMTLMFKKTELPKIETPIVKKTELPKIEIHQAGYRIKKQSKEEQELEKKKEKEKMLKAIQYGEDNWKHLKPDEKINVYTNLETLSLPIPKIFQRSYDNWVKNNRPSSLRGTSGRVPNTAYDKEQRKGSKK